MAGICCAMKLVSSMVIISMVTNEGSSVSNGMKFYYSNSYAGAESNKAYVEILSVINQMRMYTTCGKLNVVEGRQISKIW